MLGTGPPRPALPQEGVLDGLPAEEAERVRWRQRHLTELMTGRPDAGPGTPVSAEYVPNRPDPRSRRRDETSSGSEEAEETGELAKVVPLGISLAQRPETERRVAHLTGFTQIEFEQAFRLDHRPRGIPLPRLRNGLVGLVEVVADPTHNGEPDDASSD